MKPVWPNKDAQKMPSMAARLPRPAADGLYLAIPIPYPHFGAYKISNTFSIPLCKLQVNYNREQDKCVTGFALGFLVSPQSTIN